MKKLIMYMVILTSMVMTVVPIECMAASKKKITSVSIKIDANIPVGADMGEEEVEVEVKGSKYSFSDYIIENSGFQWEEDMIPELIIVLESEEGYYFAVTKKDDVKIKGAEYISAKRENGSQTLSVKVKIPEYQEQVQDIESAGWDEENKMMAVWQKPFGATKYYMQLYCNGKKQGQRKTVTDNTLDCRQYMTKVGYYTYSVQPFNTKDGFINNKGEVFECEKGITITEEEAVANRQVKAELEQLYGIAVPYGTDGPGSRAKGWYQDNNGWWYSDGARSIRSEWLFDNGNWYYLDENGYMVSGWQIIKEQKYYFGIDGVLYVNTITPDGCQVNANGNPMA